MKTLETMVVALSRTERDQQLLRYVALLAELNIVRQVQFVHVLTPPAADAELDVAAAERQLRSAAESHPQLSSGKVAISYHVLRGTVVDQLLAHVTEHLAGVVLVGHASRPSCHRGLAMRLAMTCSASVWMVPEGSPCRIQGVLAPIDFSSHSADSLSIAAGISTRAGLAECLALHVYFGSEAHYAETLVRERQREMETFNEFVQPIDRHGCRVVPRFEEESHVAAAIQRVAATENCDLIVMSTRGRTAAASVLLGSETLYTLSTSSVPVLAVKHQGCCLNFLQALTDQKLWSQAGPKTN